MQNGLSLEAVITATSFTPSRRMGFRDRGTISPGKIADFILLHDNSQDFIIKDVFKRGISFKTENKKNNESRFKPEYLNSLNIMDGFEQNEHLYTIPLNISQTECDTIACRVMRKNNKNTYTELATKSLPISGGFVNWENPDAEVNLAIVIERYSGLSGSSKGLLDGERIHNGAFCTSHAHDHHNILLIGSNKTDMKEALKQVLSLKGGMCVVSEGKVKASLALSVGGIISEAPMNELTVDVIAIQRSLNDLGIKHFNPIMSLCTLTLPVSPELKITDKGLIDVMQSKIVSLFVE